MAETTAEWRGRVSERLSGHDKDLAAHDKRLDAYGRWLGRHDVSIAKLAVKVGIGAAIGAIVGGGVATFIAYLALGIHQ